MAKAKGRSRIAPSRSRVQSSSDNAEALKEEREEDLELADEVGRCTDGGCYVDCGFMYRLRERRPKTA